MKKLFASMVLLAALVATGCSKSETTPAPPANEAAPPAGEAPADKPAEPAAP